VAVHYTFTHQQYIEQHNRNKQCIEPYNSVIRKIITFLALFLKIIVLLGSVPNTSVGNWFQCWMVLFTKNISLYPSFASYS